MLCHLVIFVISLSVALPLRSGCLKSGVRFFFSVLLSPENFFMHCFNDLEV